MTLPNHIVKSKVQQLLAEDHFWTSVVFHTPEDVQLLIDALTSLKSGANSHFHLQNTKHDPNSRPSEAEIVFELESNTNLWNEADREEWAIAADRVLTKGEIG
jgi:hypothetical protein